MKTFIQKKYHVFCDTICKDDNSKCRKSMNVWAHSPMEAKSIVADCLEQKKFGDEYILFKLQARQIKERRCYR